MHNQSIYQDLEQKTVFDPKIKRILSPATLQVHNHVRNRVPSLQMHPTRLQSQLFIRQARQMHQTTKVPRPQRLATSRNLSDARAQRRRSSLRKVPLLQAHDRMQIVSFTSHTCVEYGDVSQVSDNTATASHRETRFLGSSPWRGRILFRRGRDVPHGVDLPFSVWRSWRERGSCLMRVMRGALGLKLEQRLVVVRCWQTGWTLDGQRRNRETSVSAASRGIVSELS